VDVDGEEDEEIKGGVMAVDEGIKVDVVVDVVEDVVVEKEVVFRNVTMKSTIDAILFYRASMVMQTVS
jgi:hypothetical protein